MSIIKRISATLVSRIDHVIGEIENHDAVIQATLNEMRKKVAGAKVRLSEVRREETRLKHQIQEQQQNTQRWRQRAVECANSDESKALECVSRSRHCQQQVARLQQSLNQYEETALKLARDIDTSEQRLIEMKQKLMLMRARHSSNSALNATSANNDTQLLDETFDRWEINITHAEMALDSHETIDPIEREFITQEEQQALRSELAKLLAGKEQK